MKKKKNSWTGLSDWAHLLRLGLNEVEDINFKPKSMQLGHTGYIQIETSNRH